MTGPRMVRLKGAEVGAGGIPPRELVVGATPEYREEEGNLVEHVTAAHLNVWGFDALVMPDGLVVEVRPWDKGLRAYYLAFVVQGVKLGSVPSSSYLNKPWLRRSAFDAGVRWVAEQFRVWKPVPIRRLIESNPGKFFPMQEFEQRVEAHYTELVGGDEDE